MITLTVQELIDKLNAVEDKSKPIFGFINVLSANGNETYDLAVISDVDVCLTDRVDINIDVKV